MTDNGTDDDAEALQRRLTVVREIESLEEMLRAHRGLADCDEAIAWLDLTLGEALVVRRRWLAALPPA